MKDCIVMHLILLKSAPLIVIDNIVNVEVLGKMLLMFKSAATLVVIKAQLVLKSAPFLY